MPSPPTQTAHPLSRNVTLPRDVAMQVAERAQVPAEEYEQFYDEICWTVQRIWERDRRAVSSKPDLALLTAAKAARVFGEAIWSLTKEDREWLERIAAPNPEYQELLCELQLTVWQLDDLFSTAVGKPRIPEPPVMRKKRGRMRGSVGDMMFRGLIEQILAYTARAGGKLTFDQNYKRGTLVDVLNILRPHLPKGVVPSALPYGTIQKIKTEFSKGLRDFKRLSLPAE